ncbi:maleylpyruvate isomerase family mycothiol-dependent enzyme [Streptomyces sp. NBC_00690]|uniref:maleylpyruvate isomerase family mycothiol-dependent enzyme n=1 Tax=Streptomyces sp. NBC_00690 TaxID=2975808 RepID=UPI002E2837FB|nr:maleylpyruvate isomerase family mycothiol-dependent enzyme [Streptomyces sp. NBC_00690]
MTPAVAQSLRWMADGHLYFLAQLAHNNDQHLHGPSRLPGWSGRHLLSHLGHNAAALRRLVHWAMTGEATPMYASPQARVEEIEAGALLPAARLRAFAEKEQCRLADSLAQLTDAMWRAQVVTAQGRTIPASAIPWLRAREVWVHACDLPVGGDFANFPGDFVDALLQDALTRRRDAHNIEVAVRPTDRVESSATGALIGEQATGSSVCGPTADLARWLTGRGASPGLATSDDVPLPVLPAWL